MPQRTINHPGVEWTEKQIANPGTTDQAGTTALILGYTKAGEVQKGIIPNDSNEYLDIFGNPETDAEFYHYMAAKSTMDNGGTAICVRLPYNDAISDHYRATLVTMDAAATDVGSLVSSGIEGFAKAACIKYGFTGAIGFTQDTTYIPTSTYLNMESMSNFGLVGDVAAAHFAIVDHRKSKASGQNSDAGLFVALVSPTHALMAQRILDGTDVSGYTGAGAYPMNVITNVSGTIVSGTSIDTTSEFLIDNWYQNLTGVVSGQSVSEEVVGQFPMFEVAYDGANIGIDKEQSLWLGVVVCRTYSADSTGGKNAIQILESFAGSIVPSRSKTTGQTQFICDIVNGNSSYIKMYRNENATLVAQLPAVNANYLLFSETVNQELISFGRLDKLGYIKGAAVGAELIKALEPFLDIDGVQIDLVVDAGLSTIAQFTDDDAVDGTPYNPATDEDQNDTTIDNPTDISTWNGIVNQLDEICSKSRRDCFFIMDTPRQMTLVGEVPIVRPTDPSKTFSTEIASKVSVVRAALNSSYAGTATVWCQVQNTFTGKPVWIPSSCLAVGNYINTDRQFGTYEAPAGLERGLMSGIIDISLHLKPKDEDYLYLRGFNYIKQFPVEGFVLWGNKTMQTVKGPLNRINARRIVLKMERYLYQAGKYFVDQKNNGFTQRFVIDSLDPYFAGLKAVGGVVDYQLICDDTNNTTLVVDNAELKIGVLVKPAKVIDYVLINVVPMDTGVSFTEAIQYIS